MNTVAVAVVAADGYVDPGGDDSHDEGGHDDDGDGDADMIRKKMTMLLLLMMTVILVMTKMLGSGDDGEEHGGCSDGGKVHDVISISLRRALDIISVQRMTTNDGDDDGGEENCLIGCSLALPFGKHFPMNASQHVVEIWLDHNKGHYQDTRSMFRVNVV